MSSILIIGGNSDIGYATSKVMPHFKDDIDAKVKKVSWLNQIKEKPQKI